METNLILLILSTSLKSIVIFSLGTILFRKWMNQNQKYYSDFPFLNSLGFYFYAIGKIFDIYLYIRFRSDDTSGVISDFQVLAFDLDINDKGGNNGLTCRYSLSRGVPIEINTGGELGIQVEDDFSGLVKQYFTIQGFTC